MSGLTRTRRVLTHATSRVLHRYADFRVGATAQEKRCYKPTDSILLTFDDFGSQAEIDDLLSILQAKQVKAMFFVQGDWAAEHPELVARIKEQRHIVGNHTFSHPVLLGQSAATIKREISHGTEATPWFRPPQGRYNNTVRRIARSLGYVICYWSIDSRDWTGATVADMTHTILSELHPGAVILFHMHGSHTRELLPGLIDDIRGRGYSLTDFNEADWSASVIAS